MDILTLWLSNKTVQRVLVSIVGLVLIQLATRLAIKFLGQRIVQSDTRYRFRKFISFTGIIVAALFLLTVFSGQLGSFTVAFGIASAGIAFALQEVIASAAGWLASTFIHFYRIGDRVQLGGIKGDVIDIGILRTTLMEIGDWVDADLYNGRIVRVANSFIFKEPVFNYSADFPFLWDELKIPIKYGCDTDLARTILENAMLEIVGDVVPRAKEAWRSMIEKYPLDKERVEPVVTLVTTDNWMEYTARYVVDYRQRRAVKNQLFTRILEETGKTEGRVAIASATFHLVETPPFDVRVHNMSSEDGGNLC